MCEKYFASSLGLLDALAVFARFDVLKCVCKNSVRFYGSNLQSPLFCNCFLAELNSQSTELLVLLLVVLSEVSQQRSSVFTSRRRLDERFAQLAVVR